MPRNPFSFQPDDDNPLTLTRSPESQAATTSSQGGFNEPSIDKDAQSLTPAAQLRNKGANISARNDLHPYVQTLSLADVDSCVALENAAFPENERCSREKVGCHALSVSLCFQLMVLQLSAPPTCASKTLSSERYLASAHQVWFAQSQECSDFPKRRRNPSLSQLLLRLLLRLHADQ